MKVAIGTFNSKKIKAVEKIFKEILSKDEIVVISVKVDSKVPEAPHGIETYQGAENRAVGCMKSHLADYYVGIESGLVERYGNLFEESWAVVISNNKDKYIGYSSGLLIPKVVANRMKKGEKHYDIMNYYDKVFNLPEDNRDTWSRYTGGNISRQLSLDEALRNALIQLAPSEQNLYKYE